MMLKAPFTWLLMCLIVFAESGCKERGCTAPYASNYLSTFARDDGSCEYRGCMEASAVNFNPRALTHDTCIYRGNLRIFTNENVDAGDQVDVYVDGRFIGRLENRCNSAWPTRETNCAFVEPDSLQPAVHTVHGFLIRHVGGFECDTLKVLPEQELVIKSRQCHAVIL